MAFKVPDGCQETTTTDSSPYTLDGAVTGFEPFIDEMDNGDHAIFLVRNDTLFEIFVGTLTSTGTILTRNTMIKSSSGTDPVSWGGGNSTKNVVGVAPGTAFFDMLHRDTANAASADPGGSGDPTGLMSRGPGPDKFRFHELVEGTGPITITNEAGQSDGDITIDVDAVDKTAGGTFSGAVQFDADSIFVGTKTRFAGLSGSKHVFHFNSSGSEEILEWFRHSAGDYSMRVYESDVAKDVVTEGRLPVSGLSVGEVPIADSATSYINAIMQLATLAVGSSTGGDARNQKWVINLPIVDVAGTTLQTLKVQGDTVAIAANSEDTVSFPEAFTSTVLSVFGNHARDPSITSGTDANVGVYLAADGGGISLSTFHTYNKAGGVKQFSYIAIGIDG